MRNVMVRYAVKPDRVEENLALVRGVYAELDQMRPPGLRYTTLRLSDGVSFVHIAVQAVDGENPLSAVAAFADFQSGVGDRAEGPPLVCEWEEVGSYRFFDRDPQPAAP
jgi:hypothetical protein